MAQSKVTGVHIAMIIFAMLTLIFGVVSFMTLRHSAEQEAELQKAKTDLSNQETAAKNLRDSLSQWQTFSGAQMEEVGTVASPTPNTQIGFIHQLILDTAGPLSNFTIKDALQKLAQDRDNALVEAKRRTDEKNKLEQDYNRLTEVYRTESETHDKAKTVAITDAQSEKERMTETVNRYKDDLAAADTEINRLKAELSDLDKQRMDQLDEKQREIERLTNTNTRLQLIIEAERTYSYDQPDGEIVNVSFDTDTVWINLGKKDGIRPGLTFSVYNKNLNTVGGKVSDIKAAIEITDVLNDGMSSARILWDDVSRPLARRDKVFTPLWQVGQPEIFALAGGFDLDHDGKDDTEQFISLIKRYGGKVGATISKTGERNGEDITSAYKFLIVGDLGLNEKTEQQILDLIAKGKKYDEGNPVDIMKRDAEESGVRFISMQDFLAYMGYKPQRSLWHPGSLLPYDSKVGLRSRDGRSRTKNAKQTLGEYGSYSRTARMEEEKKHGRRLAP